MTLHFARAMSPGAPALMAVALSGRRRRPLQWGQHWLRIADRLAGGVPPAVAALPEGGDAALVGELMALEEFRELLAATEEQRAAPAEEHRRDLVLMARQAIERALSCDDVGAALFVLEEDARGRDPCATLVDSILRCRSRALASAALLAEPEPKPEPEPAPAPPPAAPRAHEPLRRLIHRGTARLRDDVEVEEALHRIGRRAAAAARDPVPIGAAVTRAAAERAQALRRAAAAPAIPHDAAPPLAPSAGARHPFAPARATAAPTDPARAPRRARAP
jgi:hypothetical protein